VDKVATWKTDNKWDDSIESSEFYYVKIHFNLKFMPSLWLSGKYAYKN
jgi:hypothetical protein